MAHEFRGDLSVPKGRLAVVVGRYNESVTRKLLAGAIQTLHEHGVPDDAVDVAWVPGAFEIPTSPADWFAAAAMRRSCAWGR